MLQFNVFHSTYLIAIYCNIFYTKISSICLYTFIPIIYIVNYTTDNSLSFYNFDLLKNFQNILSPFEPIFFTSFLFRNVLFSTFWPIFSSIPFHVVRVHSILFTNTNKCLNLIQCLKLSYPFPCLQSSMTDCIIFITHSHQFCFKKLFFTCNNKLSCSQTIRIA